MAPRGEAPRHHSPANGPLVAAGPSLEALSLKGTDYRLLTVSAPRTLVPREKLALRFDYGVARLSSRTRDAEYHVTMPNAARPAQPVKVLMPLARPHTAPAFANIRERAGQMAEELEANGMHDLAAEVRAQLRVVEARQAAGGELAAQVRAQMAEAGQAAGGA